MKLLVEISFLIVSCAGSIPELSHSDLFVEDKSRYIWLPDGNEEPRLVDLQESEDEKLNRWLTEEAGEENTYWLYTRKNNHGSSYQIIPGQDDTILNSPYANDRPLRVIVHGWKSNKESVINRLLKLVFLNRNDENVIVLDWSEIADSCYPTACRGVIDVGKKLAEFLSWLVITTNTDWNNIHLIGFSLGAHVVGVAGRNLSGILTRITGLDPAGPLWSSNINALNRTDAKYVEAIHTGTLVLGLTRPVGLVDFYPNGGIIQPGCILPTCSHTRSYYLYASSIMHEGAFKSLKCENLTEAQKEHCEGECLPFGSLDDNIRGDGIYGIATGEKWPYITD